MKPDPKNPRTLLRAAIILVLAYFLFTAGMHPEFIVLILLVYAGFWVFRGKIKRYIEQKLHLHIPNFKNWPKWAKTVITFALLITAYLILKEFVYLGFSLVGIELKVMIETSMMQIVK
ncbi:MAG: hypothetical protein ABII22_05525 [Candidatus Micrarchaeota archaeon]